MNPVVSGGDPLSRLEQLVPLCRPIRQVDEYGSALTQAISEVERASAVPGKLESLEAVLQVLKGTQHLQNQDVLPDLQKIEAAGNALEKCVNTEALRDVRFSVRDVQDALQRVVTQVTRAWSSQVRDEFEPLQRLGAVLSEITDTKVKGTELQKWATRVLENAAKEPTKSSVKEYKKAQTERVTRLEELGKLGIDTAVRAFLLDVANKQATLVGITPKVLEWLRDKNAVSRFRIELS